MPATAAANTTPPVPGDRVYLADGTTAYYVAQAQPGHVVSLSIDNGCDQYEGPIGGEIVLVVPQVWGTPPVAEKHEEIRKIEARVAELKAEAQTIRETVAAEERAAVERRKALAKWDGLQGLEDFLAGRITHLVMLGYGPPSIVTFDEGMAYRDDNGRDKGLKLLTLFGRSDGNVEWGLNRYYDGSGTNTVIRPASSYEAAVEIARQIWDGAMEDFRGKTGYLHGLNYWVDAAPKLGFALPADIAARWHESSLKGAEESLSKAQTELDARAAAVAALRASLAKQEG